jgi:hypothetical protein
MKIELTIVLIVISLIYAVTTKWFPDLPITPEVFQVVILWLLAKIGIEVAVPPANKLRSMRAKG